MPVSGPTDAIHLAVACDRQYAMPLAAMLASLAAVTDPHRQLVIHALDFDLGVDLWNRLRCSVPEARAEWHRIELETSELLARGYRTRSYEHISPVTYSRLFLPELLPRSMDRVLYLDSDMVVCADLAPLWDTDIATVDFAAAPERNTAARHASVVRGIRFHRELGMAPDHPAFNVGVLLINLRRWRETHLACRVFTCLRSLGRDVGWYEQDALNVVANGNYLELDSRWNLPPRAAPPGSDPPASILHYVTADKPWHWDYAGPHQEWFFEALDRTVWTGWRPSRPRFGRARRVGARVGKALRKRRHAVRIAWWSLRRRAFYRSIVPKPAGGRQSVPPDRRGPAELRLFLTVPCVDGALAGVLEAYADAGVDRAVILDCSGGQPWAGPEPMPMHVFRCPGAASNLALRRLLDRYGEGHWCLLGDPVGVPVDDDGAPTDLRDVCAQLDREGAELSETVTGPGDLIELIARDLRSGRVFRASALAQCAPRAFDPPAFGSRAALVKYRKDLLMDAAGVLVGNARRSSRVLRFSAPTGLTVP